MERTEALHLLASADRQYALHELLSATDETTVEELSRLVAARRHRTRPEKLSEAEIERAQVRLVHTHLPRLVENGIVTVDWTDGRVVVTDSGPVDDLLEAGEELPEWPPDRQLKRPQ